MKKFLALLLLVILTVSCVACQTSPSTTPADTDSTTPADTEGETAKVTITVKVVHKDASEKEFTITTSEKTLLGALQQENLVEGEKQSAGFYVNTVDGETADWSVDQGWWCFKKGGENLMTGADTTPIADGDHFEIVYMFGMT